MLQLYKNIKNRRLELNMTQSELATKLGYADKSMIAKIEKGNIDLTQSKIIAFAEALHTTPSELMGWESVSDEEIADVIHENMEDISKIPSRADAIFIDMVTSVLKEELKKEEFEALNKRIKEKLPEDFGMPKSMTLAAHFSGDEFTEEELDEIKQFAEFVKNKRK